MQPGTAKAKKKKNKQQQQQLQKKRARVSATATGATGKYKLSSSSSRKLGKRNENSGMPVVKSAAVAAATASTVGNEPKDGKNLLLAQEVKFARLLANNDKRVRDKVLRNLKRWLTVRSRSSFAFTEEDFMRLWKGLFYCMWMSDKPLVQEELAESLSNLVHCFDSKDTALLYTKCTLKCLAIEWFGIDRYRVDKFEMLVRKIIRQTFVMCKKQSWKKKWVVGVGKVMKDILLDTNTNCLGLKLHITDLYMEELAKISDGQIPKSMVTEFIRPYIIYLASVDDKRQIKQIVKSVFRYLIFQSDVGIDYSEKFNAWRQAGFPCTNIDDMEKVEVSDDEDALSEEVENVEVEDRPLDPRAGRVDVEIPQLPFNPIEIAKILQENKFSESTTTVTRKNITRLINDFNKLSGGEMPFGIKEITVPEITRVNAYEAAEEMINFEKELYSDSSKNQKKRKRNGDLTELEDITSDNEVLTSYSDNNFVEIKSSKSKKYKLSQNSLKKKINSEDQDQLSDQTPNLVKKKQKEKGKLNVNKKYNRLNVSDPLPKKKLKNSLKKQNNTFSECNESITSSIFDESINNYSKKSKNTNTICTKKNKVNNNWNVESGTSENTRPSISSVSDITKLETPKKKKVKTQKALKNSPLKQTVPWLTPVITRLEEQNKTPSPTKSGLQTPKTNSASKRVVIALQNNKEQEKAEYFRQILQNPKIPFDANRKPKAGVLKPSPVPSPCNPFYKKKIF